MSTAAPAAETGLHRTLFQAFEAARPAGEPAWLRALRRQAMERFEELGFPTTREEDWRYTNLSSISRTPFRLPAGPPPPVEARELGPLGQGLAGHRLVFVDGRHVPSLSSLSSTDAPDGVEALTLRDAIARRPEVLEELLGSEAGRGPSLSALAALNTAFIDDGAVLLVRPGAVVAQPLHVLCVSTGGAGQPTVSHPRTLVVAGARSQCTVVESYLGRSGRGYLTNAVSEFVLGDGAVLDHYRVQAEATDAFHLATVAVGQGRASRFGELSVAVGAALGRVDVQQRFGGEGGECALNGLFLAAGTQHLDTHTRIDHARPHCTSRELYKGVLDDRARGVFVGRILVRPMARKTDAHQANKNLLLSREALVQSVPQLEILNDDVKCKHGSTTGQIDPLALFYLRSRGLGETEARNLLVYAFASDLLGGVSVPPLREWLRGRLAAVLHGPTGDEA